MPTITLVCSAHRANGLCNAAELLRILQALEPEVAFLEQQPSDGRGDLTLEAKAVALCGETTPIRRVVVERDKAPISLYHDIQMVLDCVEQTSEEYALLSEANHRRANRYGFEYLNSGVFAATRDRLSQIEDSSIHGTADRRLIAALERWRTFTQAREDDMVRSIYDYSRNNVFRSGVFLVGAAHKAAIVASIRERISIELGLIRWAFAFDDALILSNV